MSTDTPSPGGQPKLRFHRQSFKWLGRCPCPVYHVFTVMPSDAMNFTIEFREARKHLKITIERSKTSCWNSLGRQVDADPKGLSYKIVRKNLLGKKPTLRITLPAEKTPGPDVISALVIRVIAESRSDILGRLFNMCLEESLFPEEWKKDKLVLLPNGNKPLDQISSYKSICRLNMAGKLLERKLKGRLEVHSE
ncbi:Hypothetical protein CINCED_3A020840 [Cinara cedri]|uniref:Uncharacterized protein n=1 Tax=Cinara cedri TaxID=506608 RepID=A0A5E4N5B2_9HEMI|nr:Hypothetical protein CINCED_3A020840 [Cinara cedri]